MKSILIVGAGISGIIIGDKLNRAGFKVELVDKGNAIGGRLATKKIQDVSGKEAVFDFGAQHFTARDSRFIEYVNEWQQLGLVNEWFKDAGGLRYKASGGMRDIALELAKKLTVMPKIKIEKLIYTDAQWNAIDQNNKTYRADIIVLTAPVPQSLDLLSRSQIEIEKTKFNALCKISYNKCIAGLITTSSTPDLGEFGYLKQGEGSISWVADNNVKGISAQPNKLTVHTSTRFSNKHWDAEKEELKSILINEIEDLLSVKVETIHLHKWRYSLVDKAYNISFEVLNEPNPIILAGDGFISGRIESAAISAIEASEYICYKHI